MNPVFPAHKRADEFSSLVEGSSTDRLRATGKNADLVPLVALVTSLRATPPPEPRPEFVAGLRERLMLAAETALVPDTSEQLAARGRPAPRRTGRERRMAIAVGGFALVSASASMSVAAQTALPGDTLYPLKRAIENVHESALRDADDKGATMLDNASSRLDEVDELSRSGSQDATVIARTLRDFSDQAAAASDVLLDDYETTGRLSSISELRAFTASSRDVLQRLESVVPAEVRAVLVQARGVLDEIERQALRLCPSCSVLPAVLDDLGNAAGLGPLYDSLLGEDTERPARPARDPEPTETPREPRATSEPAPPTSAPDAPAPDDEDDTPSLLPPEPPATDDPGRTTRPGLEAVVGGLETVDLGEVLTDLTDSVGGLLGDLTTPPTDK